VVFDGYAEAVSGVQAIMSENECCGTCARWKPAVKKKASNEEYIAQEAGCPWYKHKIAESKPESWCWKQADEDEITRRGC